MAVNMSRSQRELLLEGATDGKYFKIRPDTTDTPMNTQRVIADRRDLSPWWNYGRPTDETPLHARAVPGT
jgi:hypothetical protein